MADLDPFTQVFNKLWDLAEASPTLSDMVRPGNRIKYNQQAQRDPIKENVQAADLPELVLAIDSGTGNLHSTSCSSKIVRQYVWMITSGDYRVNFTILPVEWALICSMNDWVHDLGELTWNNDHFVKRLDVVGLASGLSNPDQNRNIRGWSSLVRIEVEMHFSSAKMRLV